MTITNQNLAKVNDELSGLPNTFVSLYIEDANKEVKIYNLKRTLIKFPSVFQNDLKNQYLSGGYGYGDAKKLLFNKILKKFENERRKYNDFNQNPDKVESILLKGAKKASQVGDEVLNRFRKKLGFN